MPPPSFLPDIYYVLPTTDFQYTGTNQRIINSYFTDMHCSLIPKGSTYTLKQLSQLLSNYGYVLGGVKWFYRSSNSHVKNYEFDKNEQLIVEGNTDYLYALGFIFYNPYKYTHIHSPFIKGVINQKSKVFSKDYGLTSFQNAIVLRYLAEHYYTTDIYQIKMSETSYEDIAQAYAELFVPNFIPTNVSTTTKFSWNKYTVVEKYVKNIIIEDRFVIASPVKNSKFYKNCSVNEVTGSFEFSDLIYEGVVNSNEAYRKIEGSYCYYNDFIRYQDDPSGMVLKIIKNIPSSDYDSQFSTDFIIPKKIKDKQDFIGTVEALDGSFPDDGIYDGFWYVKQTV